MQKQWNKGELMSIASSSAMIGNAFLIQEINHSSLQI
jgi:hypothetical protein